MSISTPKTVAFSAKEWYNIGMETSNYIRGLDEYFCAQFSDYVRISAIEGYVMPDVLYVARDGNIARRDSACMRLNFQKDPEELLSRFKAGLADCDFTFSFRFPKLKERLHTLFHGKKGSFCVLLPAALARCNETVESAGRKLSVEPRFWQQIANGKLYPEKNTILALALVTRMQEGDALALLESCGFTLDHTSVRDIVVEYLIVRKIFNPEMRDACLREYKIENLPIAETLPHTV